MSDQLHAFWSLPVAAVLQELQCGPDGLRHPDVEARRARFGANVLKPSKRSDPLVLFIAQFKSPIILMLLFAAGLSFLVHDSTDGLIILAIILASAILSWWQEYSAADTVAKLLAVVRTTASALRDGAARDVPLADIVPGDIVLLRAGASVPGDCLLLESKDLFVDEAALTGESFPVEKTVGTAPADAPLGRRTNVVFFGTHVVSGTARAVVARTGCATEFGRIADRLALRPPETEFEHGVRRFGYLLMEFTLLLVIIVFAVNTYFERPVLESFLFSLALAVGLTPQLLPAIISVNLAQGAKRMAAERVIVKRLAAIENFGSMTVLCADKTGTLTEGSVRLCVAADALGTDSDRVRRHAYLNAAFESGFVNPIDDAIRTECAFDLSGYEKLDEVPYDFTRKRLSILVAAGTTHTLVVKGALTSVLNVCTTAEGARGDVVPLAELAPRILEQFHEFSERGLRTLGVAYRRLDEQSRVDKADEQNLTFLGLLAFEDPPKPDIVDTIRELREAGIVLKIITGDNELVAAALGKRVGLADGTLLTGMELRQMSDPALIQRVDAVDLFAAVEPNQKERIILALKRSGHVVGFLGDGINDASALHVADVGISVDRAVDVAKEAADLVLLDQDLNVLVRGVRQGRITFANTLKYVLMASSANFGNMFSMAGASLLLPFLPLLPKQILLTNLLTDLPEMTIGTDRVDQELVAQPRRWDVRFIRDFMLVFGPISSLFDFLTFGVLLYVLHTNVVEFRTGWFIESVVSASLAVLVIRSRRHFIQSRPSRMLLLTTIAIVALTVLLPFTPLASLFDLAPVTPALLLVIGLIVAMYLLMLELTKSLFYRWHP